MDENNQHPSFAQDRAHHVATAVVRIVTDTLSHWLHGEAVCLADTRAYVAAYLRDEFADVQRTTLNEIRID